uniref:CN hydrolase domain-containing protein n=1 Tax=Timema douglasi TaxID=61478 RepID=A0A7R8W0K6_TIMDO|nr:unnamed protein product [Timema douglasi]
MAAIQLKVSSNKMDNLMNAIKKIEEAAKAGANIAILPESWNTPYGTGRGSVTLTNYSRALSSKLHQPSSVPSTSHRVVWLEGVPLDGMALTLWRGQGEKDCAVKPKLRERTDVKM